MRSENQRIVIPRDLTNFTSAGVLDPNQSQATALLSGPPLPLEEWVCIEDWYSDKEQSSTIETVRIGREVQQSPAASRSVY